MSDDEREMSEEEVMPPPEDSGPSEAERAMQRRREVQSSSGLDETAQELLEANRLEREAMEEEIRELRQRSEIRKKEREEDEKRMAQQRQEEEQRRKAEEEERRRVKEEEESKRRNARAEKMAEFEKWKNPSTPNFVITKKSGGGGGGGQDAEGDDRKDDRKSREQLEAEKKAIMSQRIQKLEIDGFDEGKLQEKAKELHNLIFRLESEKYDLEKRFKEQQYDMMELAERARQMNKVDKGGLRRVQLGQDESDQIQERFAGAPARVVMYSQFDRQKDKRSYGERQKVFTGPHILYPAERIQPYRILKWNEAGMPCYEDIPGAARPGGDEEEDEE